MATEKLTDAFVRKVPPPSDGKPYRIFYDIMTPGFGLRVTKAGAKSFILNYRAAGVERRLTIGSTGSAGDWTIQMARDEARRLRRLIDQGKDPMRERRDARAAPTVNDLIERWREDHASKNRQRTTRENERLIAQWIKPELGSKKVADVGSEEIDAIHRKITKRGTLHRANRVAALLSKLFSLAIKWKMTVIPSKASSATPNHHALPT
jgi:hypothetical protein